MSTRLIRFLASGFGLGRSPFAPGTVGTLAALPLAWLCSLVPVPLQIGLLFVSLPLGAFICGRAEKLDGRSDPGWIVLDEIVGFCIAVTCVHPSIARYVSAFVLFRLFDILKPPPAGWVDRNLPGGWGILMDDVVAGLYARLCLGLAMGAGFL